MNSEATTITVAYGDGIGPEIMEAALLIMRESGANLRFEAIEIGQRIYNMQGKYGIIPSAWETLMRNKIVLKSPIIIPEKPEFIDATQAIYEKLALSAENHEISNILTIPGTEWLSASSNISENFALFETTHDAAPEIAGKNIANPSAIIQASILMLKHIGQKQPAFIIENALLATISEGIHTPDMYSRTNSTSKVGTNEFADEIIERMGRMKTTS